MVGFWWCVRLMVAGMALVLCGLATGWVQLTVWGVWAMATVVVGWPVLLLMGALHKPGAAGTGPRHRRVR